jgi:dimeric dUTPase (all-alpha-NTP-PPase superfamily)
MTMAQEYFKRAIVIVSFYSFVILLFFVSKSGVNFSKLFSNKINLLNDLNLSGWNIIIIYFNFNNIRNKSQPKKIKTFAYTS